MELYTRQTFFIWVPHIIVVESSVHCCESRVKMKNLMKRFDCKLCGERFLTSKKLRRHGSKYHYEDDVEDETVEFNIKAKKSDAKKNSYCNLCEFDYFLESELRRHNDLRHYTEFVEIKSSSFRTKSNKKDIETYSNSQPPKRSKRTLSHLPWISQIK